MSEAAAESKRVDSALAMPLLPLPASDHSGLLYVFRGNADEAPAIM